MFELVIVESPFAGSVKKHTAYVRACMRDCLLRDEAPFASHALYTQEGVLDDKVQEERYLGMQAGFAWREVASKTVVYDDFGISNGMKKGIEHANAIGQVVEYRSLPREVVYQIESTCGDI